MTTDSAIRLKSLHKSYKQLHVLRGVDFDMARGSIFALLGSNGAGKTTIVSILSTLLKADAGPQGCGNRDLRAEVTISTMSMRRLLRPLPLRRT